MSTQDLARAYEKALEELVDAEAEVARLRAALATIASLDEGPPYIRKFQTAVQTARIALGLGIRGEVPSGGTET